MHQHRKRKQNLIQPLSPEEKNYIKYDFFSPRKFTKEKMKILRSVFENYARILTSQINGNFPRDDGHNGAGCNRKEGITNT